MLRFAFRTVLFVVIAAAVGVAVLAYAIAKASDV